MNVTAGLPNAVNNITSPGNLHGNPIFNGQNRLTRSAIEQVVNGEPSSIDCLAGSSIGVLYSDGQSMSVKCWKESFTALG